jgi:anti-anti-sigma regulatory factor
MSATVALPGELTIYTAAQTRDELLQWLAGAPADAALCVAADQVFDIDGAGVQLLCSLGAMLERDGRPWCITQPSATLTDACASLGLADWLQPLLLPPWPTPADAGTPTGAP